MKQRTFRVSLIMHLIAFVLLGTFYIIYVWKTSIKITTVRETELAMTASSGLQEDMVSKLDALPEDIKKEDYSELKKCLNRIVAINKSVRYAYLYKIKNNKVYFMVDSEPEMSKNCSPAGQEYTEADSYMFKAYTGNSPIITPPSSDRWGRWVSILVPIKDVKTNTAVAAFGLDYPANHWNDYAKQRTLSAGIITVCVLLLCVAIHFIIRNYINLSKEKIKLTEANKLLAQKEELFRTIFEQSPFGITFGNTFNKILNSNIAFEKIVGRSKEELQKLTWIDITHPDDVNLDLDNFKKLSCGEISKYSMRKRYVRPDGSSVWVSITIAPLKIGSENEFTNICMVEDITNRIKTESELQESNRSKAVLLSNLPGMAYRCKHDRNWTMLFVSEGCYSLTGYHPANLLYNRDISFNDIINERYRDFLWDKWTEVIKSRSVFKEEYSITTAENEIKWVYEQGQGVYNEKGELEAIEGLIIDISDRKKREDEIIYLNYHDIMTGLYNHRYFEDKIKLMDNDTNYPLSVIIGDINGLKLINSAIGHQEGDKIILKMAGILKSCCREKDILARTGGDEFSILLPDTTYEEADKIVNHIGLLCDEYKDKTADEAYHISISVGCATKKNDEKAISKIIKEAEESMYRHKLLQNKSLHSSIISSMKSSLYEKSQETEEHAQRLIRISKKIGNKLHLAEEQLNELELLSTLHDIGKIGINDSILNKQGPLNDEEWEKMKRHPEKGYRIAMSTPELAPIADYILNHHERWDGRGYPYGRKGEEIPLLSRIIAIADAYDAMTSDRPYRKAMSKEAALLEIRKNAGTQFDPYIAELFLEDDIDEL